MRVKDGSGQQWLQWDGRRRKGKRKGKRRRAVCKDSAEQNYAGCRQPGWTWNAFWKGQHQDLFKRAGMWTVFAKIGKIIVHTSAYSDGKSFWWKDCYRSHCCQPVPTLSLWDRTSRSDELCRRTFDPHRHLPSHHSSISQHVMRRVQALPNGQVIFFFASAQQKCFTLLHTGISFLTTPK